MELISYLLHNSYSIILGLTAIAVMATIAVILLSILQETYLTAEPSDGKTKSRPKDGGEKSSVPKDDGKKTTGRKDDGKKTTVPKDEVKTPKKAPATTGGVGIATVGPCLHPNNVCLCPHTYCGCEETGFVKRMLSQITPYTCCGCGRGAPTNACVQCDCMYHNNCFKRR